MLTMVDVEFIRKKHFVDGRNKARHCPVMVGRNAMVPVPDYSDLAELNAHLLS